MPRPDPRLVLTEQRRAFRRPVLYRLDVTDAKGGPVGYLVDISPGGMRVRCAPGVSVAEVEELRVVFPRWMELRESLTLHGRFAWCKPFEEGRTEGGFVFDRLTPEKNEILAALMEKIADAAIEDEDA